MEQLALAVDPELDRSLYLQLGDALAAAIASGALLPGERLPSERDLAEQLGLSRTTVVNAYREVAARGLVRGHVGRGTFVCADPTPTDAPFAWRGKVALGAQRTLDQSIRTLMVSPPGSDMISFAAGMTALDCFPLDAYRALSDAILRRDPAALGLGRARGNRCCGGRWRHGWRYGRSKCSSWPGRSRGSIWWRAACSIRAIRW